MSLTSSAKPPTGYNQRFSGTTPACTPCLSTGTEGNTTSKNPRSKRPITGTKNSPPGSLNDNVVFISAGKRTKKSIHSKFLTINMPWNVGNSRGQPRAVNSINQATTAGASAVATAVFSASGTMVLANILFASRSAGGLLQYLSHWW